VQSRHQSRVVSSDLRENAVDTRDDEMIETTLLRVS
jgi:hypothetical protein